MDAVIFEAPMKILFLKNQLNIYVAMHGGQPIHEIFIPEIRKIQLTTKIIVLENFKLYGIYCKDNHYGGMSAKGHGSSLIYSRYEELFQHLSIWMVKSSAAPIGKYGR